MDFCLPWRQFCQLCRRGAGRSGQHPFSGSERLDRQRHDRLGAALDLAAERAGVRQDALGEEARGDQLGFEEYEFLAKLHHEADLYAEGYGYIIGYHGTPGDDEGTALMPDSSDEEAADSLLDREGRMGIGGHIHVQMDRALGGWRVINVGSIGMSFDQPGKAEYGLFTFEKGEAQVDLRAVPYDVEAVIADSQAHGNPATALLISKLRAKS